MGEILLRSGVAGRIYDAMAKWLTWLPAVSCIRISEYQPSLQRPPARASSPPRRLAPSHYRLHSSFHYNQRMFLGSLAAGGTLGILIPPSINMLIYGFITDTSVPKLYLAALVPAAILCVLFMATIVGRLHP